MFTFTFERVSESRRDQEEGGKLDPQVSQSLWTSLIVIVPAVSVDVPNSPYGLCRQPSQQSSLRSLWTSLIVIVPAVSVDVPNSPYGLCGRP